MVNYSKIFSDEGSAAGCAAYSSSEGQESDEPMTVVEDVNDGSDSTKDKLDEEETN